VRAIGVFFQRHDPSGVEYFDGCLFAVVVVFYKVNNPTGICEYTLSGHTMSVTCVAWGGEVCTPPALAFFFPLSFKDRALSTQPLKIEL
jgi:hypothetical protein